MIRRKLCFNRSMVVLVGYVTFILLLLGVLNVLYPHKNIVPKGLICNLKPACTASQLSASYWFPASSCSSSCADDALVAGDKNPGNVYTSCFDGEKNRCLISSVNAAYPPFNAIIRTPLLSTGYAQTSKLSPCSLFGALVPEKPDFAFPFFDLKTKRIVDFSTCTQQFKYPKFACTTINNDTQTIDVSCYVSPHWSALSSLMFDYQFDASIHHADMMVCDDIETVIGSALPYVPCTKNAELFCKTDTGVRCFTNPTE